jgi:hypothetical protein
MAHVDHVRELLDGGQRFAAGAATVLAVDVGHLR